MDAITLMTGRVVQLSFSLVHFSLVDEATGRDRSVAEQSTTTTATTTATTASTHLFVRLSSLFN
jgi:hypothetical protein